jgi:broad specificity phosphatase PhoE
MSGIFIRHGQSTGNAGMPCTDLATIERTEKGWNQARQVAAAWTQTPSAIVTSPFLRTQQTAARRSSAFRTCRWRWDRSRSSPISSPLERHAGGRSCAHLVRYWDQADPAYCDGEGAESFGALLRPRRERTGTACHPALPRSGLCF